MSINPNDIKLLSVLIFLIAIARLLYQISFESKITFNEKEKSIEGKTQGTLKNDGNFLLLVIIWVLISRGIIHILGYIGLIVFKNNEELNFLDSFKLIWVKWDASHFLNIAENWYKNSGEEKYFIVFYPLYPLTARIFYFLTNDYFWSSILVSNISLIISCFYLYKLTGIDHNEKVSFNSLKYLLISPFSFFLGLPFSDSLFIALSIMTLYYIRKNNCLFAGIFGFLASLTRSFGILLLIPTLIEYLITNKNKKSIKAHFKNVSFLLFIPSGFLVYLYLNKAVTGDCFKFIYYLREHWYSGFRFFPETIKMIYERILWDKPIMKVCIWIPDIVAFSLVLVLAFYSFNKLRTSYISYMLVYLFFAFCHSWPLSGHRYITGLFPIYIALGLITSRSTVLDFILTFTFLTLLSFYTISYATGAPIM